MGLKVGKGDVMVNFLADIFTRCFCDIWFTCSIHRKRIDTKASERFYEKFELDSKIRTH